MNEELRTQIIEHIKRPIPQGLGIVEHSVPVVFFGNIEKSIHATLSINPSCKEFCDSYGELLTANKKRIVDRDCLRVADDVPLTDEQAERVYQSLIRYFDHKPYKTWFNNAFEDMFKVVGVSHYSDNMCHLDISPWATKEKWKEYTHKKDLLREEFSVLGQIITTKIRFLYVNGRTAIDTLRSQFPFETSYKPIGQQHKFLSGNIGECKVCGCTADINHPFGERQLLREQISEFFNN